jgi:ribosomal protein S12 methylthiotransferase
MRRGTGWAPTESWLRRIRAAVPGMVIRTTLITGFPGETEEDFEFLLEKVREFEFDHLGVFAYSKEEGTPAADLGGEVPEDASLRRRDTLLSLQRGISWRRNRDRIGKSLEVMIDSVDRVKGLARGRWAGQALEIDGQVVIPRIPGLQGEGDGPGGSIQPGDMARVRIQGAGPYDLVGTLEEEAQL